MDIPHFLKTIYVGDRSCKSLLIDGENAEVKIQVSCISRVRSETWNYYTAEDMPDGFLIFEGVTSITLEPAGFIPNDLINGISVQPLKDELAKFLIAISVDSVNSIGDHVEIEIRIHADSMALESNSSPGERITD